MGTDWKRFVSVAVVTVSSAWQGQALAGPTKGPTEYRVVAGDTCGKVAQKVYGDGKHIELIHQHNKLGPKPHRLKAGMVLLIVPPETGSVAEGPDAQLTFVRNEVEAYTPGYHPGRRDEPLLRGHRVGTRESSSAQITFRDETQLQLSENTLVVILGDTSQRSTRERRGETVLLRGSLMARLGDLAGTKPAAVATPGGRVEFVSGQNEAHLAVDEKKTTRLSVHKGNTRLASGGKSVPVGAGFGTVAENGKPPTTPRPLPAAPHWLLVPPLVLTRDASTDLRATYEPGLPNQALSTYHVQLARDADFNDLIVDARVPTSVTELHAKQLPPGTYHLRVSARDAQGLQGAYATASSVQVAQVACQPATSTQPALVTLPDGVLCALDDADASKTGRTLPLAPGLAHRVRCGQDAQALASQTAPSVAIAPAQSGQPHLRMELGSAAFQQGRGTRSLQLLVTDATGAPTDLPPERLGLQFPPGVTHTPLQNVGLGQYTSTLSWPTGQTGLSGALRIAGLPDQPLPIPDALPPTLVEPPRQPPPEGRWALELAPLAGFRPQAGPLLAPSFGLEIGARFVLPVGTIGPALRLEYEVLPERTGMPGVPLFALSLPVSYRFRALRAVAQPYIGLAPVVLIQPPGGLPASTTGVGFALAGLLGLQLHVFHGGPFFEAGYRRALALPAVAVVDSWHSGQFLVGYRFQL